MEHSIFRLLNIIQSFICLVKWFRMLAKGFVRDIFFSLIFILVSKKTVWSIRNQLQDCSTGNGGQNESR